MEEANKQLLIDELIKAWEDAASKEVRNMKADQHQLEECKPLTCHQLDQRNESVVNVQPSKHLTNIVESNHSLIFKELQMRWNNGKEQSWKAPQEIKKSLTADQKNDDRENENGKFIVQDNESEEMVVDVPKMEVTKMDQPQPLMGPPIFQMTTMDVPEISIISPTPLSSIADIEELECNEHESDDQHLTILETVELLPTKMTMIKSLPNFDELVNFELELQGKVDDNGFEGYEEMPEENLKVDPIESFKKQCNMKEDPHIDNGGFQKDITILETDQLLPTKMKMIKYLPNFDQSASELEEEIDKNRFEENIEASKESLQDFANSEELIKFDALPEHQEDVIEHFANLEVVSEFKEKNDENGFEENVEASKESLEDLTIPGELVKFEGIDELHALPEYQEDGINSLNFDQFANLEVVSEFKEKNDENGFEENVEASKESLEDLTIPGELVKFEGIDELHAPPEYQEDGINSLNFDQFANLEVASEFKEKTDENEFEEIEDNLEESLEDMANPEDCSIESTKHKLQEESAIDKVFDDGNQFHLTSVKLEKLLPTKITMIKCLPNFDEFTTTKIALELQENNDENELKESEDNLVKLEEFGHFEGSDEHDNIQECLLFEKEIDDAPPEKTEPALVAEPDSELIEDSTIQANEQQPQADECSTESPKHETHKYPGLRQSYNLLIQKLGWVALKLRSILQQLVRIVKHVCYGSLAHAKILKRRRQDFMDQLSNDQYVENILKLGLTFTTGLSLCVILVVFLPTLILQICQWQQR